MSFTQITLELDGSWVLEHRLDEKLPIKIFIDSCQQDFDQPITVTESSFAACTIKISNSQLSLAAVRSIINKILTQTLAITVPEEIATVTIENVDAEATAVGPGTAPPAADHIADGTNADAGQIDAEQAPAADTKAARQAAAASASTAAAKKERLQETARRLAEDAEEPIADKIAALIGAAEFKALAREITTLAPHIIEHKTFEAFAHQSYLFAINEGCGLTTYLQLLAGLIETNNLMKFNPRRKIMEEKLLPPDSTQDPFAPVLAQLQGYGPKKGLLLSIDISEWMTKITARPFRNFLACLEDYSADNIFVFRIPFVETEVLATISAALRDVLFIRPLSFPPLDAAELTSCGERFLARFGFTADAEAWTVFQARIMEEKSDGRFYGLNTVNKIIREMVYRKQLSDALHNRDDLTIKKADILTLTQSAGGPTVKAMDLLYNMIGMEQVRTSVEEIVAHIELSRTNKNIGYPCIHMRFVGSPGTGKTTVARIIGQILKERGVLRNGNFFEYSGRDFCGRYIGETAPKTASMCRDAYGSVLFIDEAYSFYRGEDSGRDFGREALDTLIAEMENHRHDLVVIMAGYTDEMAELMRGNTGLESRMPYIIEFPNYTREQLCQIFFKMLGDSFAFTADLQEEAAAYFAALTDEVLASKSFSNARFVRNLFERTCAKANMRTLLSKADKLTLTREDFRLASSERAFQSLLGRKAPTKIGF